MNDYYDYYDYYGYSSTPAAVSIVPTIISLVLCVFVLVCMWIIFRKANKPGWAAIVPFYNLYVMFEITWGSGWRHHLPGGHGHLLGLPARPGGDHGAGHQGE